MIGLLRKGNRGLFTAHPYPQARAARVDRQIPITEPPDEVEGRSRRLRLCKAQRIGRHRRLDRRAHLGRGAEEPIGRGEALEPLVRTLEVVVLQEQPRATLAILEVGEHGAREELLPHRLPEALDLAAGLRVVRTALDVADALAMQLLFEPGRAAPGGVLAPLVGEDLARDPVVGDRARQRLQHERTLLVVRHREAHDVARVIVQERGDIHPLVPAQQEREEVRLPELIGLGTLEASVLGPGLRFGRHTLRG
jgi:hypothetical protein